MEEAGAGQIVVSQRIAEAAAGWYRFEHLGAAQLRGKTVALPIYSLEAGRLPSRQRPATAFAHRLVGRDDELAQMEQLLQSALSGRGRILRLVGTAGIGKSHLAAEFVERTLSRGLQVVVGACHSTTQGIAYAPWRQVFRAMFDLSEEAVGSEDPSSLAARHIAQVSEAVHRQNRSWLPRLPLLGDLLGLPIPDNQTTAVFDARLRQESLLALAVELMQSWASERPLVLLIEDVHWMDEASLALTTALGRALDRSTVLLVLVHRPPGAEDSPLLPHLDRLPCCETMVLGDLPPQGIRTLVTHRLGGEPSSLAMALIEKLAQGNPFFAEELVDALGEEGGLQRDQDGLWVLSESIFAALREAKCLAREDGHWFLAHQAPVSTVALGIPDSVQGLVLSRIDRLPEPHKLTLKVAGVVGRSFEFDLLTGSHPAGPGRETLLEQMEVLQTLDFVRLEMPEPQRTYLFKHSITQEVVYQTLLEDQRRELHGGIGEALEQLLPEAIGRLAYHYSRSGVRDKAVHYLLRAGEQAAARYANIEAVDHLGRALDLLPETDLVGRYETLLAREKVLDLQGEREAQHKDLAALQSLVDALQDDRKRAEVGLRQAHYAEVTGDYDTAIVFARDAVHVAQSAAQGGAETSALQAAGYVQGGLVLFRQGEYDRARSRLEQALALARASHLATVEANVLRNLGNVATRRGDYDRARSCFEQALALHRAAGDIRGEGLVLNNLGIVVMEQGDYAGGLAHCEQSLDRCREVGDRRGACMALGNLGNANHSLGDYARAQSYYEQSLEWSREIGDRYNESMAVGNLGVVLFEQGDCDAAKTAFGQNLSLDREMGDQRGEALSLGNLGDVLQVQGHYERAKALYDQALCIYRRIGVQWGEGTVLSRLCRVLQYMEDNEAALDSAWRSVGIAQDLGDRPGEAAAWRNLGGILAGLQHWEKAADAYEHALDLQRTLGQHNLACESLAGLASVTLAQGDQTRATGYVEEILAHLQTNHLYGAEEPFRVYWTCWQTLQTVGDPRAEGVLSTAHGLLQEWAVRVGDEEDRRSFLEQVAINRKIVQAFSTL
jgi:predicted ATPase